jgi:hypothetical protein
VPFKRAKTLCVRSAPIAMCVGLWISLAAQEPQSTDKPAPVQKTKLPKKPGPPGGTAGIGLPPATRDLRHASPARTATGRNIVTRANGRPSDLHLANRGMDIHHGLNGTRRVETTRGDRRIVAEGASRGYVEGSYRYGGREYRHRTYYYGGRSYDRFYRGYYYRGGYVEMYVPAYYYPPAFYGWAYNPWVAPVPYAWGFAGSPWYGYYGAYFTPYPVYPSASFWLTDYLISQSLAADYQARVAAQQQIANSFVDPGAAPLTPEVKGLISAEVQRQIAISNAEAQPAAESAAPNPALSGVQAMLGDNISHVFVVGRDLDVVDSTAPECALSQGDALQLVPPTPPDAAGANLLVLSTKGGKECRKGASVNVAIADLQEMQNYMRETIDQGMGVLQTKQGTGGLPTLPPAANAPPAKALFAAQAPPPDPTAATQINEQLNEADRAEKEVLVETVAPPAKPVRISLGQTLDEVSAALGQPLRVVDLGAKKIYVYKDVKITFSGGKVSDVQ